METHQTQSRSAPDLSFYEDTEPEVVNELKKLYVDDLATSSETDHKAYQTYKTAKQIMSEGQFNLRKWRTNSKTLLKRINEDEKLPFDDTQLDKDLRENVKVLGLCWNTNNDEFTFDFKELIKIRELDDFDQTKCFAVWGVENG